MKQKKRRQAQLAKERIEHLFELAESVFKTSPKLSNRYIELARKIAMHTNVRLPSRLKRRFCKKCHAYLVPGVNCRVRTKKGKIIYCCLNCGYCERLPFVREKREN